MPPTGSQRPIALASALLVGITTMLVGAHAANADFSGPAGQLTSSNGSKSLSFADGHKLTSTTTITDADWSPDGSRAIFIDDRGRLVSVRYDNGNDLVGLVDPLSWPPTSGNTRSDPTYVGDGGIVWVEQLFEGDTHRIAWAPGNTCCAFPETISPFDYAEYTNPDADDDAELVVQRQLDGGTPEIGFLTNEKYTRIIDDASNPAIAPDGTRVAFIRSGQVWVATRTGSYPEQLTFDAAKHDNPAWSPDGTTIAFNQGDAVATVSADGSGPATPRIVDGLSGKPAYQSYRTDQVYRLAGTDRYSTATKISQSYWASATATGDARTPANAVVLSRSDTFADALGGSALAAAKRGPLLLTPPTALDPTTQAEIQRVLAPGKTVYLLGSPGAISQAVQSRIEALGYRTERIAGADRFATAIAIANAIDPDPDEVLVATGMDFPDALAAGAAAGAQNAPGSNGLSAVVILTNDDKLPPNVRTYLDGRHAAESLISGHGALAFDALAAAYGRNDPNLFDLSGSDRFETAAIAASVFANDNENHIGVATGMDWPDALAGGALMANLRGPLLLTHGTGPTFVPAAAQLVSEASGLVHTGLIFGSAPVINAAQVNGLGTWMSGPQGFNLPAGSPVLHAPVLHGPKPSSDLGAKRTDDSAATTMKAALAKRMQAASGSATNRPASAK